MECKCTSQSLSKLSLCKIALTILLSVSLPSCMHARCTSLFLFMHSILTRLHYHSLDVQNMVLLLIENCRDDGTGIVTTKKLYQLTMCVRRLHIWQFYGSIWCGNNLTINKWVSEWCVSETPCFPQSCYRSAVLWFKFLGTRIKLPHSWSLSVLFIAVFVISLVCFSHQCS